MSLPGEPVLRLPVARPRPKGYADWTPRSDSKAALVLRAAEAALARYAAEGRLPLGPREIGYVLTGDKYGFTKGDIDMVEDVLVRARRAGKIPWEWISDGRTGKQAPWEVEDGKQLASELAEMLTDAQLDRQAGQRYRVGVWAEAMGWLPRAERICNERGVTVYSGSGSVPVPAIRAAALRAIHTWDDTDGETTTVLLWLGDLDLNGIRNIATPFADDVMQFVRDTLRRRGVDEGVADDILVVRRLLLTAGQVEQHVGERGRLPATTEAKKAGWPYPYTAQAEALPPEIRDQIVTDAIDSLHDVRLREQIIGEESALHAAARQALRANLDKQ